MEHLAAIPNFLKGGVSEHVVNVRVVPAVTTRQIGKFGYLQIQFYLNYSDMYLHVETDPDLPTFFQQSKKPSVSILLVTSHMGLSQWLLLLTRSTMVHAA